MTHRSTIIAIFVAATAVLSPAAMSAQITTFVAPPRKAALDTAKATVAASAAKADTTRMSLSDMKAWVDSAAGVGATTRVASADASAASATEQPTAAASTNPKPTTSFANGAIAPNTASPLPFYFAAGFVLVLVGVGTLRLARRRA